MGEMFGVSHNCGIFISEKCPHFHAVLGMGTTFRLIISNGVTSCKTVAG